MSLKESALWGSLSLKRALGVAPSYLLHVDAKVKLKYTHTQKQEMVNCLVRCLEGEIYGDQRKETLG